MFNNAWSLVRSPVGMSACIGLKNTASIVSSPIPSSPLLSVPVVFSISGLAPSRVVTALAVVILVFAVIMPSCPMIITIVMSAVPAVVRTSVTQPVRTLTPVIDFAKMSVMSVFFVNAMVFVLVIIMTMGTRRRRVTWCVIMLVTVIVAVGCFAGVAIRQNGVAEG